MPGPGNGSMHAPCSARCLQMIYRAGHHLCVRLERATRPYTRVRWQHSHAKLMADPVWHVDLRGGPCVKGLLG